MNVGKFFNEDGVTALIEAGMATIGESGLIRGDHLLCGVLSDPHGLPRFVLHECGVDGARLHRATKKRIREHRLSDESNQPESDDTDHRTIVANLVLTPFAYTKGAREILKRAVNIAHADGYATVGSGHLLLAILADTENPFGRKLADRGVDGARLREAVLRRESAGD